MYRIDINPNHVAGDLQCNNGDEANVWAFTAGKIAEIENYTYIGNSHPWPEALLDAFNVFIMKNDAVDIMQKSANSNIQSINITCDQAMAYSIVNILSTIRCKSGPDGMPIPVKPCEIFHLCVADEKGNGPGLFCSDKWHEEFHKYRYNGVNFTKV